MTKKNLCEYYIGIVIEDADFGKVLYQSNAKEVPEAAEKAAKMAIKRLTNTCSCGLVAGIDSYTSGEPINSVERLDAARARLARIK